MAKKRTLISAQPGVLESTAADNNNNNNNSSKSNNNNRSSRNNTKTSSSETAGLTTCRSTGNSDVVSRVQNARGGAATVPRSSGSGSGSELECFESLRPALSGGVLQYVVEQQKFRTMTPVQSATIPQFRAHRDVIVQAVTGSGKTLAYLIPIVEMLIEKHQELKPSQIGALVLAPTRELAQQIGQVATELCQCCQLKPPLLLVGGGGSTSSGTSSVAATSSRPVSLDLHAFKQVGHDLVIGTPGRVADIFARYAVIDCSELEYLVLDEADVLLGAGGFDNTIQDILSKIPKMRRTGLFSATVAAQTCIRDKTTNTSVKNWIAKAGLRNPVFIDVAVISTSPPSTSSPGAGATGDSTSSSSREPTVSSERSQTQATPTTLQNYYLVTTLDQKLSRLVSFLDEHTKRGEKIMVFFLTCACVEFFGTALQQLYPHLGIESLHGRMVQKRREKTMERFRATADATVTTTSNAAIPGGDPGDSRVLFCTDVAARGLDVSNVHWVVQFDAPQDPAFFVHRVGRSARAGKAGSSLLMLTNKEEAYLDFLSMRRVPLTPLANTEVCCPPPSLLEEEEESEGLEADHDTLLDEEGGEGEDGGAFHVAAGHVSSSIDAGARVLRSAADPKFRLDDVLPKVRGLVLWDRDLLEKGTKAFMSYICAYKEHHCAFIFRFASLNLGLLATSFCLLRLPKMPELAGILKKHDGRLPHFTPAGPEVDIIAIPYRNKVREVARQKRLQEVLAAGGKSAKRIKAEQRKADKERKEQQRRQAAISKGRNPDKKRGRNARLLDEWDDLAKEERLVKKLRRGKITKEQFDGELYGDS